MSCDIFVLFCFSAFFFCSSIRLTTMLIIHLDNPLPSYSGNEVIQGRVIFDCSHEVPVQDIRLILTGRAKSKVQKAKSSAALKASYRGKANLFEKEKILLSYGGSLTPQKYEWPFGFVFPAHAQPTSKGWSTQAPFQHHPDQPLPPTFAAMVKDELRELECSVEYRLEAIVTKPGRGLLGQSHLFREIVRLPCVPLPVDLKNIDTSISRDQHFTIRSLFLLPENRSKRLTFQEKMQSWFGSDKLPRFTFKSTFRYPTRISQSIPLNCSLGIDSIIEDSSVTSEPTVTLRSISLVLVSQTAARASPSLMGAISGQVDERVELISKPSVDIPVSGRVDLAQLYGPLVLNQDVSFSTFNMCRSYKLCANLVFECVGKSVNLDLNDLRIEILPHLPQEQNDGYFAELEGSIPTKQPEGEDPPAYTPPPKSSGLDENVGQKGNPNGSV